MGMCWRAVGQGGSWATMKKASSTMPTCLDFLPLVDGFLLSVYRAVVSLDFCFRSIGMAIYSEWISE